MSAHPLAERELAKLRPVHVHDPEQREQNTNKREQGVNKSLFTGKPFSEWLDGASQRPVPKQLCGDLWFEGEFAFLFASTGVGKTAFAVQVANQIAGGQSFSGFPVTADPQPVGYFDFELSDAQQLGRYAVARDGYYHNAFEFSPNLKRFEMQSSTEFFDWEDWESVLLDQIEQTMEDSGAKVWIIDNITSLARETDKGKFALPLMQRLNEWKKRGERSLMVLAHTPKRDETRPITVNDLAGSRILANFADAINAIGRSATDPSIRYIKQLKARSVEARYDGDTVAMFLFEKRDNFLGYKFIGESSEREHLRILTDKAEQERIDQALELQQQGKTQRQIAEALSVSLGKVNKILNVHRVNEQREQNEHVNKVNVLEHVNVNTDDLYFPPGCDIDEVLEAKRTR